MSIVDDLEMLDTLDTVALPRVRDVADLQTRRDRKYLIPRHRVNELVDAIRSEVEVLAIEDTRLFRYESVYFDTTDLASYLAAARRRPRRFKVRTRTYVETGDCVLEVKTRDARGQTVKHRHPYDLAHRAELTDAGRSFVASVAPATRAVDDLRPTLATTYRRSTLVLCGGPARVTIDIDLEWLVASCERVELPCFALVETKTSGPPCPVDRALWRLGHRPVTISKYCTGMAAIRHELPANKWNRTLRRHFDRQPAGT